MSRVSKSLIWSGIEQFCISGGSFVIGIIIARLVTPEAYGLIAMMQVFISFCQLIIEGGLTKALIQKIDRTETDFHTVFFINFVISLLLYLALFFCSPWIAKFYNNDDMVVPLRVLGLIIIIQSISIIQKCNLTITLNFRTQALVSIVAIIISGAAGIYYAYKGGEIWALILQSILYQSILSIGLIVVNKWRPKLIFSITAFKVLFTYGYKELLGNILTTFYLNLTNLLIGKFYSPASLSFYNRGFQMALFPSSVLTNVVNRASFPILCENQNKDHYLINLYLKFLNLSCYIVFPVMAILSMLSENIIHILLGNTWIEAAKYVSVFSIVFALYPINMAMVQIIYVIGKPQVNLKSLIIKRVISTVLLCLAIPFGVEMVAYSLIIGAFIDVIISGRFVSKELKIKFWIQFKELGKIGISVGLIILLCFGITCLNISSFLIVMLSISGSGILYLCLTLFLKMPQIEYLKLLKKTIHA